MASPLSTAATVEKAQQEPHCSEFLGKLEENLELFLDNHFVNVVDFPDNMRIIYD